MKYAALLAFSLMADAALAEDVVPSRTIRVGEVLTSADLVLKATATPGAIADARDLIGQEARIVLYPGRPVFPADVGPPALIDRNQLITLVYIRGGLEISTEGRALGRGAEGDRIRVMNLASRTTVTGRVNANGTVSVH